MGNGDTGFVEEGGDDSRSSADWLETHVDRAGGLYRCSAMVIDDGLDCGGFDTFYGLAKFIVIDEDNGRAERAEEIRAREHTEGVAKSVDGWDAALRGEECANIIEDVIFADRKRVLMHEEASGNAHIDTADCFVGMVGAGDEIDLVLPGELDDLRLDREAAGHDQGGDAVMDERFLDIMAVTDYSDATRRYTLKDNGDG